MDTRGQCIMTSKNKHIVAKPIIVFLAFSGIFLFLCIASLTSCKSKNNEPEYIKASTHEVILSSTRHSQEIEVSSNIAWELSGGERGLGIPYSYDNWLQVTPAMGNTGKTKLQLSLTSSVPNELKQVTVVIKSQNGSAIEKITVKYTTE